MVCYCGWVSFEHNFFLLTIVPKTKTKKIKKRDTMKKLDTATEMKAVAKICDQWKYAKAHNVGDALQSTLIRDTRTELNKAS